MSGLIKIIESDELTVAANVSAELLETDFDKRIAPRRRKRHQYDCPFTLMNTYDELCVLGRRRQRGSPYQNQSRFLPKFASLHL